MSEPRNPGNDLDDDLRHLLDTASAATAAPTPFDPALALAGGYRRRARRRAVGAAFTAACVLAIAVVVLPDAGDRAADPPADGRTPTPTASADAFGDGGTPDPRLQRVLNNVSGFFERLSFAGADHAATVQYSCTVDPSQPDCDSAVIVTRDGFRSAVAHLVPGVDASWVHALPDGSAAYNTGHGIEMLLPDNSIEPVTVTTEAAGPGDGVLVRPPPYDVIDDLGPSVSTVWVLDPDARSLAPLSGAPRGAVMISADGTVTATRRTGSDGVSVVVSRDGGRTWSSGTPVKAAAPDTGLAPFTISGPPGRLALLVVSGGPVTTLDHLWVSDDDGETWRRIPSHPSLMNGVTFADDGTLLVVGAHTIWRSNPDLTELAVDHTLPAATLMTDAGTRTYMQTSGGHFTSGDGLHWRRLPWKAPGFTSADSADSAD